jgi:hypothetical protein
MTLIYPKKNFQTQVVIQLGLPKNILFVIFLLIYSIVEMDVINLNLHLNLILQKTCELKFRHFLDSYCFQTYLAQIISLLILGPIVHKCRIWNSRSFDGYHEHCWFKSQDTHNVCDTWLNKVTNFMTCVVWRPSLIATIFQLLVFNEVLLHFLWRS